MYIKIVFANYFSFTNVLNDGAGRRTARLVWSPTVNNNRSKWVAMGETPAQMHMSWWASVQKQLSWIICSNELLMLPIRSRTKPIYFYQLANSDSAYATRNRKYIYIYMHLVQVVYIFVVPERLIALPVVMLAQPTCSQLARYRTMTELRRNLQNVWCSANTPAVTLHPCTEQSATEVRFTTHPIPTRWRDVPRSIIFSRHSFTKHRENNSLAGYIAAHVVYRTESTVIYRCSRWLSSR